MIRERELGACYAYSKADGSAYRFARDEYARLHADWLAGKAFFTGRMLYGSTGTLKLGDIVAIIDTSSEELLAGLEDRRADEADDRRDEMLTGAS
jgi:hypothetical protein